MRFWRNEGWPARLREAALSHSLYRRWLGPAFDTLSPQVRALHEGSADAVWTGDIAVERGTGILARLAGVVLGLPPAMARTACTVSIAPDAGGGESWTREFGGHRLHTTQWLRDGLLHERMGQVVVGISPHVKDGELSWRTERATYLGLPLLRALYPNVTTREWEHDGRYCFDVRVSAPVVGLLFHYAGTLTRSTDGTRA